MIILSQAKTQIKILPMRYFLLVIVFSYLVTSCSIISSETKKEQKEFTIPASVSGEIPKEARQIPGYEYPAIPLNELKK
jgi:hypothetical protein